MLTGPGHFEGYSLAQNSSSRFKRGAYAVLPLIYNGKFFLSIRKNYGFYNSVK